MYSINLTNNETSEIKYEVSKFPDGQQQVKILGREIWPAVEKGEPEEMKMDNLSFLDGSSVKISSRLNNFIDLEKIICATKSLRNLGVKEIHLYTPYFLGSRSDRKFEEGSNNYLKDIICTIINNQKFNSVTVLDPHSDVLEACLNNFKKVDNLNLVNFTLNSLYSVKSRTHDNLILISPDAGANKKIFKIAEQIGYKGDVITCSKSRDENGKLSNVIVPLNFNHVKKDFIIIDDICDGGATFLNIAKEIEIQYPTSRVYLIVTHGIFSKGFEELSKYFDGIYCTNSYHDIPETQAFLKENKFVNTNKLVKQLNVF